MGSGFDTKLNARSDGIQIYSSLSKIGNFNTLSDYVKYMSDNSMCIASIENNLTGVPIDGFFHIVISKINRYRIELIAVKFAFQTPERFFIGYAGETESYKITWNEVTFK